MTEQFERGLDAAGYVVLKLEYLDDRIAEGSDEANFEDGH